MDFAVDIKSLIAKSLKISDYPEEVQEEIITKLAEIAAQRVLLELTARLPEGKRDEFLTLVEQGGEGLEPFLLAEIPDFAEVIQEGVQREVKAFLAAKEGR